MLNYKLKPAARQFFKEEMHTNIGTLNFWAGVNIPIELLDEVSDVHIVYGHQNRLSSGGFSTHLRGMDYGKKEGKFYFTIVAERMSNSEWDNSDIAGLMDKMQVVIDRHFKERKRD